MIEDDEVDEAIESQFPAHRAAAERFDSGERMPVDRVEIGQWYWIDSTNYKDEKFTWFGCVAGIGSNYVEFHSPRDHNGSFARERVHVDDFDDRVRFESNHGGVIGEKVASLQARISLLMSEVTEVTRRLGVAPVGKISDNTAETGNALAVVSSQVDTSSYKRALIEAKEKTLPNLFKEIEETHKALSHWMMAPALTVQSQIGPMKKVIKGVEERIYTIELYAGLTEDAVQIREGVPANMGEKLHVMQRRLYMDEECLVRYEAGGMEFKDIDAFDAWLAREGNMKRILPFERCLVAFRVRRYSKVREAGSSLQAFINFFYEKNDKLTFLYIRNGDQLWRVNCNFDFGHKIVPDQTEFDPSQPMMVSVSSFGTVEGMITVGAWELMRDEEIERLKKHKEWVAEHPGEHSFHSPYGAFVHDQKHKSYKPFDSTHLYFDEIVETISAKIKEYNRVAVIIQGLFDRSLVLHPHPPVRVWDPINFASSIEIVYDSTTLTHGDKPDFEAYRARLNASLGPDSIVIGQDEFWGRREAWKEMERRKNDRRYHDRYADLHYFRPEGNPGPGIIGPMAEWKGRSRKAVFRWERRRLIYDRWNRAPIPVSIAVPDTELFNVSAYKPGDFRQFFEDPRTRSEYVKWAPFLLAAEDWHAGKRPKERTQ